MKPHLCYVSVSLDYDAQEFHDGLANVIIAQRANLEEGHVVIVCVGMGGMFADLAIECEMQTVAQQDLRDARCVLRERSELRDCN